MPHLRNPSSSPPSRCPLLTMGSSHVDENTDATNGVGGRAGEYRRNTLGDGMSSSTSSNIISSNGRTDSSLEDGSGHTDDGNNRHDDGKIVPHHTSHLRDTSLHDSVAVTNQTSKANNIITPSTEKCSSDNDEKTLDNVSLSNQTQKQESTEGQRLPLQDKQLSIIQDTHIDRDSSHKIFVHGHDDATRAAVAMTSLGAAAVPDISSHTYATDRTNAVTPVAHGMKRKRDLDGGDYEQDESHESSATEYQTPLPTRMTVASPHSEARVHPVTAGSESNLATANAFASKTSHELETANALTKVAHFHQDNSSWSKTPSLLPGSMSSSSWYTPNAGQPSETSHGFFSGAMHSTMYYPEHVVVVGSRGHSGGGVGGGNISSDGTVGYTTNPFPLGTSTEYFVPNASFYTPHRSISSQYQSFHHPHGHHPISQHGKTVNLEECNGVPLNHPIENKGEGNLKDIVEDRRNSSTGKEKAINRYSSTYSQYPQTPTAHIRSGTETPLSSNISSQHYHGYYYPPLSAMRPSSVANGSQLNQASMQYQACYNPRTPSSNTSNTVETKENDSDGEGDKGLCLHNCDRVFIAKNGFVPNKVFPKDEDADAYDIKIPPFQQLVNYPHSSQRKRWGDEMRCVMCGEKHFTSHSRRLAAASQIAGSPESDNMYIIPKQNKGLCTACDNSVWKIRKTGKEIKWCKGCKNFKAWEAFGEKYLATKCVKCREKQKEKYARKTGKLGSDGEGSARKETPRSSSKSKRDENNLSPHSSSSISKRDENDLFFVTGQRKGGNTDQGLSFLIAASNRVSEQD